MADISRTAVARVARCVAAMLTVAVPPHHNVAATSLGVRESSLRCLEVLLAAA